MATRWPRYSCIACGQASVARSTHTSSGPTCRRPSSHGGRELTLAVPAQSAWARGCFVVCLSAVLTLPLAALARVRLLVWVAAEGSTRSWCSATWPGTGGGRSMTRPSLTRCHSRLAHSFGGLRSVRAAEICHVVIVISLGIRELPFSLASLVPWNSCLRVHAQGCSRLRSICSCSPIPLLSTSPRHPISTPRRASPHCSLPLRPLFVISLSRRDRC